MNRRCTIGIIAGSGPEAGIDLWSKVLKRNKAALKDAFRGDLDAPRVIVRSEPLLGLSMELERHAELVWASLRQTAAALSVECDIFAIACNTLNWFAPNIEALGLPARFLSFQSVVTDWLVRAGVARIGLMGAAPVVAMNEWSAYRSLADTVAVETPRDVAALHALIHDVKSLGSGHPSLRPRFRALVDSIDADTVLLACTELPLITDFDTDKTLVDVTDLVADALVAGSLGSHRPAEALMQDGV